MEPIFVVVAQFSPVAQGLMGGLFITLLVSLHLWRVRKDGGLAANSSE